MHYLVTGGAGFIGSHLIRLLLAQGHRISVIDNLSSGKRENLPPGVSLTVADITDPGVFDALLEGIDGCFHLAAIVSVQRSIEEKEYTHAVNYGGTVALFDAIGQRGIPVVYASSAAVYGDLAELPQREAAACNPLSPYGADKLACEHHAVFASSTQGIPSVGLRFFNVYGPGQDASSPYSGVISIFAQRMQQHQPVTIFGDGGQSRDFIFVADVAAALSAAMQALHSGRCKLGVFNVCTGISTSIKALAALMADICHSRSVITPAPARGGDIRHSLGDPGQCQKVLGFEAAASLAEGLGILLGQP